jgi:hypothetical protein
MIYISENLVAKLHALGVCGIHRSGSIAFACVRERGIPTTSHCPNAMRCHVRPCHAVDHAVDREIP